MGNENNSTFKYSIEPVEEDKISHVVGMELDLTST